MRRVSVILVALLSITSAARGQMGFGAKVGMNIANASVDPSTTDTKSSRLAFLFGGVIEMHIGGPLFIQPEVLYVQKGMQREGTLQYLDDGANVHSAKYTLKIKLSYIEIPLFVKVRLLDGSVRPYGYAGPSIAFRLKASDDAEVTGVGTEEIDLKNVTSSIDVGIAFGLGAEFRVAPLVAVTLDARYSLGLTDIQKDEATEPDTKVRTRGMQFLGGIMFFL